MGDLAYRIHSVLAWLFDMINYGSIIVKIIVDSLLALLWLFIKILVDLLLAVLVLLVLSASLAFLL